jgi:hypothetical protein
MKTSHYPKSCVAQTRHAHKLCLWWPFWLWNPTSDYLRQCTIMTRSLSATWLLNGATVYSHQLVRRCCLLCSQQANLTNILQTSSLERSAHIFCHQVEPALLAETIPVPRTPLKIASPALLSSAIDALRICKTNTDLKNLFPEHLVTASSASTKMLCVSRHHQVLD